MSRFEDLSGEILMAIFEYMAVEDVWTIFFNMNSRFNSLVFDSRLRLTADVSKIDKQNFEQFCLSLIHTNFSNIFTLILSNNYYRYPQIHLFLSQTNLLVFQSLHALTLIDVNYEELSEVIQQSKQLPLLNYFHVNTHEIFRDKELANVSSMLLNQINIPFLVITLHEKLHWSESETIECCNVEVLSLDFINVDRLGRELNIIRQKINLETTLPLMIEIMQRAKKLLRTWKNLLTTVQTDAKPRLILKVKLNSTVAKRKRDSCTHSDSIKRKKIDETQVQRVLPRLKTTAELLLQMQTKRPIVKLVPIEKDLRIANLLNLTFHSNQTSTSISTLCASYTTVADLLIDHRRRIFALHDAREIEARPDLLFPPMDQLAYVYQREQTEQVSPPSSSSLQSSLTAIETLDHASNLIALPFIDCPWEFELLLDELVIACPRL